MTTQQKRLVRESFPSLVEVAGPVAQLFYGRLFQMHPSARAMFRSDIRAQGVKFMDMLTSLVGSLDDFEDQLPALRAMGQRHAGYGVTPQHYATVGESLIWALAQALNGEFSGDVKVAWVTLIGEVGAAMKAGAAELNSSPEKPI